MTFEARRRDRPTEIEVLRGEYSPRLLGVPVWRTHTVIPHFTAEELAKAWDKAGTVALGPETPHPLYGTLGSYVEMIAGQGTKAQALMLGNINYGSADSLYIKWGLNPQGNAKEGVGFGHSDRVSDTQNLIIFEIVGSVFQARVKNTDGQTSATLTWNNDYSVNYHLYVVEWFPEVVRFFIDNVLVATIYNNIPFRAEGLVFVNDDNIGSATTLRVKQGLELQQFLDPSAYEQNVPAYQSFVNPASNPTLDLFVGKRRNLEVYANSIGASKTVNIYGSRNRTDWRLCDTLVTASSSPYEVHRGYANGYRWIRVVLVETGTGTSELEISAN